MNGNVTNSDVQKNVYFVLASHVVLRPMGL